MYGKKYSGTNSDQYYAGGYLLTQEMKDAAGCSSQSSSLIISLAARAGIECKLQWLLGMIFQLREKQNKTKKPHCILELKFSTSP